MKLKIRITPSEGEGIVFDGENIEEICREFNLTCLRLRSKATYKGECYNDYKIMSMEQGTEANLLAGDVVFKDDNTGEISVIPYMDFIDYWEVMS